MKRLTPLYPHEKSKNILYIHGGPGGSSFAYYEFCKKNYTELSYNIWFYDQPGCGKNTNIRLHELSHSNNILDLKELIDNSSVIFDMAIGHSYGAWLLNDFLKENKFWGKSIFLSMSKNLLLPRYNNLMFELITLQRNDKRKYNEFYKKIKELQDKSWILTEEIRKKNTSYDDKFNMYWANLDAMQEYNNYLLESPSRQDIFFKVRESIHCAENQRESHLRKDQDIYHAIGAFDLLMGGVSNSDFKTKIFYGSSHFPHVEEVEQFQAYIQELLDE